MSSAAVERHFPPEPGSCRKARHFVADYVGASSLRDDVLLVVSELATNVVKHAMTPFTVRVSGKQSRLRVEVSDGSSVLPPSDRRSGSRGLQMVEVLADSWGILQLDGGKVVWAEFARRDQGSAVPPPG